MDLYSISTSVQPTRANYPPSEWLEREGWTVPVIVDDDADTVGRAFGLNAFPFNVFVDADGVVIGRVAGGIPIESLLGIIDQISAG